MSEQPERIYLQQKPREHWVDWEWCVDKVWDDATEYVRADIAQDEIERLKAYKANREQEDAELDDEIDRIMQNLPPLKPGKASKAMIELRALVGMETGAIGDAIIAAVAEIKRLQSHGCANERLNALVAEQEQDAERQAEQYAKLCQYGGTLMAEIAELKAELKRRDERHAEKDRGKPTGGER